MYYEKLSFSEEITYISNLMWEKESRRMSWSEAIEYSKNLRLGNYEDWRLATLEELLEMVTLFGGTPVTKNVNYQEVSSDNICNKDYQFKYQKENFKPSYYWSSQCYDSAKLRVYDGSSAWCINFGNGSQSKYNKFSNLYVRCVRINKPFSSVKELLND